MTPTSSSRTPIMVATILGIIAVLAVTFGVVGIARASSGSVSVITGSSQQAGIAVCGQGKADAAPDRATLDVGVFSQAATAEAARAEAATTMSAVIAALKSHGIADKDIQTSYFSIQPQYSYGGGNPVQIGYTVSNSVTVIARDVSKVGTIIDSVTQAGGNHVVVNGVTFSAGDPSQALATARMSALADAHTQATQIASAAGVNLGPPISIDLSGCGTSSVKPPTFSSGAGAAPAPTTPIQSGNLQVAVQVAVVYSIR